MTKEQRIRATYEATGYLRLLMRTLDAHADRLEKGEEPEDTKLDEVVQTILTDAFPECT